MILISKYKTISLTNGYFSYIIRVTKEGILEHLYYGSPLSKPHELPPLYGRTPRGTTVSHEGIDNYNLNDTPQEYPCFGTSDFRYPAFHGLNADGNTVFALKYKSHKVSNIKEPLSGLPSAQGGDSETLIVTLEDKLQGLEADLHYTIYKDFGVLARSVLYRNTSKRNIQLLNVYSTSLALPATDYELLHLSGTWAREFNAERMDVPKGRFVIESARGTSSAAHSPFAAIMERGANEEAGHVYAATLIYSGNHSFSVETGEFGDVRLMAGINPFNFGWVLEPNETFTTPEALQVYSGKGLRGMSHIWHDFIREKISPQNFKNKARPSYINTWEAGYFDVNQDKVLSFADKAKDIGVQMLVLDDGWFEGRKDDNSSLGDWTADLKKFPKGIPWLAAQVKNKDLKFGLWVEPEMVNPDSQLFRAHPDWAIQSPERTSSLGRNQLTLDLTQSVVTEYLFEILDGLLACGDINYVKWDMNRSMSEVPAQDLSHRYMLGLYSLLNRLTEKYPDVLFENCASGGNRFDLGMLSYMAQSWPSDMCDPIGRLEIINGASYLFPLDVMAAYIGPSPNHQNGRETSIKTRFMAGAFCAARGISLSERDLSDNHKQLSQLMRLTNETAGDMVGGRFDRLIKNDNEVCWQYSSRHGSKTYLLYFHILSAPNLPFRRARLVGLDPDAGYILQEDGKSYQGDTLMSAGLPMPYVTPWPESREQAYMDKGDFSSVLFVFDKAPSS